MEMAMQGYQRHYDGAAYAPRHRFVRLIARILDFAFTVIYTLLGVRFLLAFFDARRGSGFYELIVKVSDPFYGPFRDILRNGALGTFPIVWSLVVAMLAYGVLHGILRGVLHVATRSV